MHNHSASFPRRRESIGKTIPAADASPTAVIRWHQMKLESVLNKYFVYLLVAMMAVVVNSRAFAELEIEIVKNEINALPVAIVPFAWNTSDPAPITGINDVVSSDLYRSGLFDPLDKNDMIERPSDPTDLRFGTWRLLKVDAVAIGQVRDAPGGGYTARYWLFDVNTGEQLLGQELNIGAGDLRFGAHKIADQIFETLIGTPGAFATRIAYVVSSGVGSDSRYELVVADSDGVNPQSIVTDGEPLLSPAWSSDGSELAYVSFARGNSTVIVQNIFTGSNRIVAEFKGINGSPAFSPDGTRLAMTLSRSGSPEINIMDMQTGRFTQLTQHWAIDTEPVWNQDGSEILFTSDRGGKPQIYSISPRGGNPERVTWEGEYNARGSLSPDGNLLATTHGNENIYRIAVFDRVNQRLSVLSDGRLDESPSFAPNGSMVLYASKENGKGVLYAVSVDGNVRQRLVTSEGDVREPAWSPLVR